MSNNLQVYENEFQPVQQPETGAMVQAESAKQIAEVKAKVFMAKQFPRDKFTAVQSIGEECQRKGLASQAVYSFPRGGQTVMGPSIRLAEVLARYWGNMEYGFREIDNDGEKSVLEAYAWDMQTNTRASRVFEVPHVRHTRKGIKKLSDPRDVYEMCANYANRRVRACILQMIPGDVVDRAALICKETCMKSDGDIPLEDRVIKMIAAFKKLGIKKEHIEERLGYNVDSITVEDLYELMTIYNAIKDGHSKRSAFFEISDSEPSEKTQALKDKIKGNTDEKNQTINNT